MKKYLRPIYVYLILTSIFIVVLLLTVPGSPLRPPVPVAEPPVPVAEPPVPFANSIVKVANRQGNATFNGYGIAVDYKGTKFILTSQMLLIGGGEVTVDGEPANVFSANLESDLAALSVYTCDLDYIDLEEVELLGKICIGLKGFSYSVDVTIKDAELRNGWMALEGAPAGCEGSPVFQQGRLVGLMLGFSKNGTAIAATNEALIQFAEQIRGD